MLTPLTQTAIAILYSISCKDVSSRLEQCALSQNDLEELLSKLETAGLICLSAGKDRKDILSFELMRPTYEISLLEILEATGENLNCNHEPYEEMYLRYGRAARKLGVVNHMTRLYLSEIKLAEL